MPRSPTVYSLPPGTTPQQPNAVIGSAMFNSAMDDIAQTFNTVQPVVYGGTGAATIMGANDAFSAQGANIASAATTDIGAATGTFVDITGTTTITGLGTVAAGAERTVRFTGILTLTHNATSLILYSRTNITTYNGLIMRFISLGAGNWMEVSQTPAVVNFTPNPNFGGGVVGIAGTFTGRFTRLGNWVDGNAYFDFTNKGSSVGDFAFGGFSPVARTSPGFWPGTVSNTLNFASMLYFTSASITGGQNAVRLYTSGNGTADVFVLGNVNFTNTSKFAVHFSFECDP